MEYILFIHNNTNRPTTKEEWNTFFTAAHQSGIFAGGSEIANRIQLGHKSVSDITKTIGGHMRFEAATLEEVTKLLKLHPVLLCGGTLELCEMPKTKD